MKKVILFVFAAALLLVAPVSAKTVTVDISKLGFVPANVALQVGDTVTFTNKDTATHQVVCQTCPFTSPVLKAGETFSYQFTKAGKFSYVDPLNKNKKGTATVAAAPATLSLSAKPTIVTYGGPSTLSGVLSTQQTGVKVDILAQNCGETPFKVLTTVTTTTGGAFSAAVTPSRNTTYQAHYKAGAVDATSANASVKVRPRAALKRVRANRFSASVTAADSFVGKALALQRYVTATHRWSTVKTVVLKTQAVSATPVAGSVVSKTTFGAKVKAGTRVRVVLPPAQTGTCYVAARSATVRA
jgi:plastocyanin